MKDGKKQKITKAVFVGKVVKQGNSLCVRIPFREARKIRAGENSSIYVEIANAEKVQIYEDLLEAYQNVPELKKYSLDEIKKNLVCMAQEKYSGKNTIKNADYLKFKRIVLKNKKRIKKNLFSTKSYKTLQAVRAKRV